MSTAAKCPDCGAEVAPSPCFCGTPHAPTKCWPCHHKEGRCAAPHCPEHGFLAAQKWMAENAPSPATAEPTRLMWTNPQTGQREPTPTQLNRERAARIAAEFAPAEEEKGEADEEVLCQRDDDVWGLMCGCLRCVTGRSPASGGEGTT